MEQEQQQQIKDTFVMAFAEDGLCTKEDFLAQMAQWEQQAAEQDKVFDQKRQEAVEQGSKVSRRHHRTDTCRTEGCREEEILRCPRS